MPHFNLRVELYRVANGRLTDKKVFVTNIDQARVVFAATIAKISILVFFDTNYMVGTEL